MKKYLKTIEDIEALRNTDTKILYEIGKDVESNAGEYYKFVNGVLCGFSNDTLVAYNTMLACKCVKYFIEVEDELSEDDIGKLGWFWDDEDVQVVDVLKSISPGNGYFERQTAGWYRHFRPLTPEEVEKYTGYKVAKED